jgi:hypothetical protein
MNFGIVIWCLLSIFFALLLIITKIAKLKTRFEHIGFRILANIAVESIDEERVKEILKRLIKESIREYESEKIIKNWNDGNSNTK